MNHEPRRWSLQEAKAKFSEVVRRAQTEGPQMVTVHGKEAVIVSAALECGANPVSRSAWQALRSAGPYFDFETPERPLPGPIRPADLP